MVSGLVICAVVAAVSQFPVLLEGQKLPKYYLLWQNTSAVSSCRERSRPVSECPHCPQSCRLKAPLCKLRAPSLGCFSICRSNSHAHLPSFPCSFGLELGRGRNWHDAELAFLGCAIKRRNLGGNRTEGDMQGVGMLNTSSHLCRVRVRL